MLFFYNIRFQIAAAAVLIIIIFDYLRNPHLKLMSTNAFRAMLICTVCNLMLDISTVYTVTHLDTVPPQLNRFLHQLFIASVIMVLFFNFLYVLILNRNQERLTKRTFGAVIAPLAISAAVIIAGKLEFFASDKGAYSYGPMADMVYVLNLLSYLFDLGFKIDHKLCDGDILCLGADSVCLTVELLDKEIKLPAHRLAETEHIVQLLQMALQADSLLCNGSLICKNGSLGNYPLLINILVGKHLA